MILTISDDRKINASTIEAGYREENKAFKLEFEIPEYLSEYGKKACFRAKDGTKFAKIFDNTIDNTLTFTSDMTKYKCLDCTIEFFKTENEEQIIAKTSMLHININNAIITDDIQEDDPQAILLNGLIENVTSAIKDVNNLKNTMQQAEDERNTAESSRNTAEKARKKAETTRETAENDRNSTETSRATAESIRKKNESDRIINENGRIEAENSRSNAETSRNNAETQRQSNETARQTAEDARKDYITTLRQSIENGDFDGATFIPHLDENGDLSWSNNKELDNPPTINIMGPRGPQGETGPKPVAGTDYYTQEEKEDFAAQVIAESKTEIDNFTSDKKDEITDLATDKLKELSAVNTLKIISEEVIDL